MTYTVSSGALNSTPSIHLVDKSHGGVERQSPIRGLGKNNVPRSWSILTREKHCFVYNTKRDMYSVDVIAAIQQTFKSLTKRTHIK